MKRPPRRPFPGRGTLLAAALLAGVLLGGAAGTARAQDDQNFVPGFGFVYGQGRTENGAETTRFGFTSRRLKDNDRIGSLALMGEEHFDGVPVVLLDPALSEDDVEVRYQSLYIEMKRYIPLGGPFLIYWALRGGYSRIQGKIRSQDGAPPMEFEADLTAPLALLALPLVLENPGFLMLAFLDGTAAGLTLDIVPQRIWLEYQIGAVLIPNFRNAYVAIEERTNITQTLQLLIVF